MTEQATISSGSLLSDLKRTLDRRVRIEVVDATAMAFVWRIGGAPLTPDESRLYQSSQRKAFHLPMPELISQLMCDGVSATAERLWEQCLMQSRMD